MITYIPIAFALGMTIFWLKELIRRKIQREEHIVELTSLRGEMQDDSKVLRLKESTIKTLREEVNALHRKLHELQQNAELEEEKEEFYLRSTNDLFELIEKKDEKILELVSDNTMMETLITMKDAELNARDDERDMHWEEMKRYLLAAQASKEKNSKLIVINNCCECNEKDCVSRMPTDKIPQECPLKDAHALYSLQITVKGFSTAKVMDKIAAPVAGGRLNRRQQAQPASTHNCDEVAPGGAA